MSAPLDIPSLVLMCTSSELIRLMRDYPDAANDENGFALHNKLTDAETGALTVIPPPLEKGSSFFQPDPVCLSLTPMLVFSQAKGEPNP